jgi:flagellar basal body-associated protein FliL
MEEYMRVMSDDDDEPSQKKSVFSFFKKKKKLDYDEIEEDNSDNLYDSYSDDTDEDTAEEIPVVPFDASDVKYEDEYSNNPEEYSEAQDALTQEPMNLYDYIEADFDYAESEEEYAEDDDDDAMLDVSFMSSAKAQENLTDMQAEAYEEAETVTSPTTEEAAEEITEEAVEETQELPCEEVQETEEAEDIITPEEETEFTQDPTAGMVFEDIFSVTDEAKRSHTGGNWTEVFVNETPEQSSEDFTSEIQVVIPEEDDFETEIEAEAEVEAAAEEAQEAVEVVIYPTEEETEEVEESAEAQQEETVVYSSAEDTAEEAEPQEAYDEIAEEAEEDFDDYDAPKKRTGLRIVMAVLAGIFLIIAGATAVLSAVIGVDSGKIFSDNLRAFSVPETIESVGVNKGDLVITKNVYAQADNIYVYVNQADGTYNFGKVTKSSSNSQGDYLYVSETKDGLQLINRDTSMGVVVSTYAGIGSLLSALCNYSIYIIIALVVFAAALIVCFVIITRKRRLYEEASAIYDRTDDNHYDYSDEDEDSENGEDDDDYYGDFDTDGIEQGLFNEI